METENDLLNLLLKSPNSERIRNIAEQLEIDHNFCLLYTSPSPRDTERSRMPSSA